MERTKKKPKMEPKKPTRPTVKTASEKLTILRKKMESNAAAYHRPVATLLPSMDFYKLLSYCHPFQRDEFKYEYSLLLKKAQKDAE